MKLKQTRILTLIFALIAMPLALVTLSPATTHAYKCTGINNTGEAHYYKDGVCYKPIGTACLDTTPSPDGKCVRRDQTQDEKQPTEIPVKNDGSAVTNWTCSKGTFNAANRTCETCTAPGSCTVNANVLPTPAGADTTVDNTATPTPTKDTNKGGKGECAGAKTDYFACKGDGVQAIGGILKQIILIVSIGVGIVAVGGIIYGAVLYASAQDNQEQVKKSIGVIRNVVIGLLLYTFMVAIVNWLIPGGVIG